MWVSLNSSIKVYYFLHQWLVLFSFDMIQSGLPCSAGKESTCNAADPSSIPGSGRSPWRRDRLPPPVFLGFPDGSVDKESPCNPGELFSINGLVRSHVGVHGNPLQYSGLENSMDCIVHGIPKSWTQLNDFHSHSPQNCQIDFSNTCLFPLPSSETLNGSILPIAVVSKPLSPFCQ